MAAPTMLSPSSLPQTSGKVSERTKRKHKKPRTFENNGVVHFPGVAKSPHYPCSFKKHPACMFRVISEDADPLIPKILNRALSEFTSVCFRRWGESFIEVGVLLERQTSPFVLEMAEHPKNF
jgi:hypothetical protein